MNILHIHNDWKWTGPSEPILNLCYRLKQQGHNIFFACLQAPRRVAKGTLPDRACEKGIEPLLLRRPRKLTALFAGWENINRIEKFIHQQPIDIIHAHSSLDHFIAAKAVRHLKQKPKIIRTNHKGIPLLPSLIINWLIKKHTDGYITLSRGLLLVDRETFHLPAERSWFVEGAIDLDRFNKEKVTTNLRTGLGIKPDDLVFGVVARIQRHRRFEVILSSFAQLVKEFPNLKLLVMGRGTYQTEILTEPVRQMGLGNNIIHAGYRRGDYVEMLAVMNAGIFLVPGSDGSCRAVREMMALAKPVIVSNQGILPELIQDNVTGLVIEDTVERLTRAIRHLITHPELITKYGRAARTKAINSFALEQQIKQIEQIYQMVLSA